MYRLYLACFLILAAVASCHAKFEQERLQASLRTNPAP